MLEFARDKALWEKIRTSPDYQRHRDDVKAKYESAFSRPVTESTFWEIIGDEKKSRPPREREGKMFQLHTAAIMSLIYPDVEEYFDRLIDVIWAYCNEYSWAPMGHYNEYYGVTRHDYYPELIDIYAASLGMALTEIKHLFADRLPRLLYDRLTAEIRRHIIEPYKTKRYFWEHHDNNWASVCAGGVGAVLMYEDPILFRAEKGRLERTMEGYLASFGDDGVCVEGSAYWGFGFGFYVNYAMLLREFTEGREDWFKKPKVKSIAMFLQKIFLGPKTLVTFSDVNPAEGYWLGMPHMLRDVYGDEIEKLPADLSTITVYQHFPFMLRSFIYYNPDYVATDMTEDVTYVMPDMGWLTKRTKNYGFAMKGGNNGESHNHIDVGNFILARKDKQILCDLGAGHYENGYHGEARYTFFTPSSYAHNIPIFDGVGEDPEKQPNVIVDYDEEKQRAHCEFAAVYVNPKVKRVDRSIDFHEDGITLTDLFEYDGDKITERFVTAIEPKWVDGKLMVEDVLFTPSDGIVPEIKIEKHHNHIYRPGMPTHTDVYCMDYTLPKGKREFTLRMEIL